MRTLRNLAFLVLIAVIFAVDQGELRAYMTPPPFNNCPDGCNCTVTWDNWLEVTGDCPEVASADACPYVLAACGEYCDGVGWWLDQAYPQESHSCGFHELVDGCSGPFGLEPPTEEWTCGCYCWVS